MKIKYLTDNIIRLRGPVLTWTNTASTTGTCNASLYHDRKDTFTTAGFGTGVSVWPVYDASLFTVNIDTAVVERSDGTIHNGGLVTARDLTPGANTITVTTALTSTNVEVKSRVMVQLGAVIVMSAYGTATVGTYDWGYRGVIQSDHDDLNPGVPVRIEILLNDTGTILTEILRGTVSGGT